MPQKSRGLALTHGMKTSLGVSEPGSEWQTVLHQTERCAGVRSSQLKNQTAQPRHQLRGSKQVADPLCAQSSLQNGRIMPTSLPHADEMESGKYLSSATVPTKHQASWSYGALLIKY